MVVRVGTIGWWWEMINGCIIFLKHKLWAWWGGRAHGDEIAKSYGLTIHIVHRRTFLGVVLRTIKIVHNVIMMDRVLRTMERSYVVIHYGGGDKANFKDGVRI